VVVCPCRAGQVALLSTETHARTHATDTRDGRALRQIDGPVAPYTGRALSLSL